MSCNSEAQKANTVCNSLGSATPQTSAPPPRKTLTEEEKFDVILISLYATCQVCFHRGLKRKHLRLSEGGVTVHCPDCHNELNYEAAQITKITENPQAWAEIFEDRKDCLEKPPRRF